MVKKLSSEISKIEGDFFSRDVGDYTPIFPLSYPSAHLYDFFSSTETHEVYIGSEMTVQGNTEFDGLSNSVHRWNERLWRGAELKYRTLHDLV
jgi:hypothetical protein